MSTSLTSRPLLIAILVIAAFFGGALWVTDGSGLYRLTATSNDTVATPFSGGRLHRLQDQLL